MATGTFSLPISSSATPASWSQANYDALYANVLTSYTRPADWLTMPTLVNGDKKIAILHRVDNNDNNFVAFTIVGSYTVDWGDGTTVQNFSGGATAQHQYLWSNVSSATLTSEGFRQVIITITPQASNNLTSINFNVKYNLIAGLPQYDSGFLDMKVASQQCTSFTMGASSGNVVFPNLREFEWIGSCAVTSYSHLFNYTRNLCKVTMGTGSAVTDTSYMFQFSGVSVVVLFDTSSVLNCSAMFQYCYNLVTIPTFNFSLVTDSNTMFQNCTSLVTIPLINLSSSHYTYTMFYDCTALSSVPALNLSSVQDCNQMFYNCQSLEIVSLMTFSSALTNNSSMFYACNVLKTVPLFNFSGVTNGSNAFLGCNKLESIPLFNFSALTNGSGMFGSCYSLKTIPLFNFGALTSSSNMFGNCYSLTTIPLFVFTVLNDASYMFSSCYSLTTIPLLNFSLVTNAQQAFYGCYSLKTIPLLNLGAMTNGYAMFGNCYSLTSLPLFNLSALTNGSLMFTNCQSLRSIPLFNLSNVTTANSMFYYCYALVSIPAFNLSSCTDITSIFANCYPIIEIPAITVSPTLSLTPFSPSVALCSLLVVGTKVSFDISNQSFGRNPLETVFKNLGSNVSSQTVTISNNWGATGTYASFAKASSTTNISNAVVTQSVTTNLAVGQLVTGTGISDAVAVTFTDVGDTVNRTAHGLPNGKKVYFATIVTTTGITVKTPYYVVNATANTFQVSLTSGGTAINLVTNGSGTVTYPSYITAITANTNFTLDVIPSAAGTITATARMLDTSLATLKGWTVTG